MEQLGLFDKTESAFRVYHEQNPAVYRMFCVFTKQLLSAGRKHLGAKMIAERIRFETAIKGTDGYRINNSYVSFFARMFEKEHPEFGSVFEFRKSKADEEITV